MKEKHLDKNGKNIKVGDVVFLHEGPDGCGCSFCKERKKKLKGVIGIVRSYGCICVEIEENETIIIWDESNVEVMGKF